MKTPWAFRLTDDKLPYVSSVDGQVAVALVSDVKAADGRELRLRIDPATAVKFGTALIYQGMKATNGQDAPGQAATATPVRRRGRRT